MNILIAIYVYFFLEALLEEYVIKLKNGSHPDYARLNKIEHFRSGLLAAWVIAVAFYVAIFHTKQFLILPSAFLSRRIFFDWSLIVLRDRPRHKYEGNDWWNNIFRKIFGQNGRVIEHVVEIIITVASITMHIIFDNKNIW